MANGQPPIDTLRASVPGTADPKQVQVLLASNIADDDQLWVVRCSVSELHELFLTPVDWVTSLGTLPNWVDAGTGKTAPAPVLTADFGMMVETTEKEDPDGWVIVQGISKTNCLKVIATKASAIRSALLTTKVAEATAKQLKLSIHDARAAKDADLISASEDPFAPFWKEVAMDPENPPSYQKKLLVEVVYPLERFFAHFEVMNPTETAPERAARAATFLLASIFDPDGEISMLNGLDQETLYVQGPSGEKGPPITLNAGKSTTAFYANIDRLTNTPVQKDGDPVPPVEPPTDCVALDGTYYPLVPPGNPPTGGSGTVGGGMLKRYGVDSPGPRAGNGP